MTDTRRNIHVCIPVRLNSSRLPGKALKKIGGKTVLRHVLDSTADGVLRSGALILRDGSMKQRYCRLCVLTDKDSFKETGAEVLRMRYHFPVKRDSSIGVTEREAFGVGCIETAGKARNGTERAGMFAESAYPFRGVPALANTDIVIIIQCDMVHIDPNLIADFIRYVQVMSRYGSRYFAATAGMPQEMHEACNRDRVTVAHTGSGGVSKGFFRGHQLPAVNSVRSEKTAGLLCLTAGKSVLYSRHVGMYAYTAESLKEYMLQEPTEGEVKHSLEQLRWLDSGHTYHVMQWRGERPSPIDSEKDLEAAIEREERRKELRPDGSNGGIS